MENRTKFNLKENIIFWKSELSQNSNMTLDNINELESHLQDEIDQLQQVGLSSEESLIIAKNRIGNKNELATEFAKVNKGVYFRSKIIPYLKGILLFIAYITITEFITSLTILIASKTGLNEGNQNFILVGLLITSTLILLITFYKKYKSVSLDMSKLTNIPILVTLIILSKLLTFYSQPILSRSIGVSNFGFLYMHLHNYKIMLVMFILSVSCIVIYLSKKENKMGISE